MGTPAFAVPTLRALVDRGHDVAAVFTQPDRPAGRGQAETASAVKRFALERGLRVEQPQKLRDPAVLETLRSLSPQAIAVAAYGKILPKSMLELPPLGAINVHGSLLPRHRGAAPIQRAILAGDATTGITIMQMNEGMDTGDMLLQEATEIRADDTAATLAERLAEIGARLLVEALDRVEGGTIVARPQNDAEATLAPMVKKEEGEIDWRRSAAEIERAVRAFTPWPSAYTKLGGKLLKVHRAAVVDAAAPAAPGTVVDARGDHLDVATGGGSLRLCEVQLEGKRRLRAREFLAGQPLRAGDQLG
jgi:methionyl-tRNA formyltransferase